MVAELSAWVALVAAFLSIGLEIWKARRPANNEIPISRVQGGVLPPFLRGVSVTSALPIAALILAAHAIGLTSDDFYVRAEFLDPTHLRSEIAASVARPTEKLDTAAFATPEADVIEANRLESVGSFLRAIVTLLGLTIAVLLARFLGAYGFRAYAWSEERG